MRQDVFYFSSGGFAPPLLHGHRAEAAFGEVAGRRFGSSCGAVFAPALGAGIGLSPAGPIAEPVGCGALLFVRAPGPSGQFAKGSTAANGGASAKGFPRLGLPSERISIGFPAAFARLSRRIRAGRWPNCPSLFFGGGVFRPATTPEGYPSSEPPPFTLRTSPAMGPLN